MLIDTTGFKVFDRIANGLIRQWVIALVDSCVVLRKASLMEGEYNDDCRLLLTEWENWIVPWNCFD